MDDHFFDSYRLAEFYDDLYGSIEEDIPFWRRFTEGAHSVLELACGTGRVTLPLAQGLLRLTALDYSTDMLDRLSKRLENLPRDVAARIIPVNGDMREIDTGECYDAVIIPSNSLNHIETEEDLHRTFEGIERHLGLKGGIAFDILNPDPRFLLRNMETEYDHRICRQARTGRYFLHWESSWYDKAKQINHVRYYFQYCDAAGRRSNKEVSTVDVRVRLFFPKEIDSFLRRRGYAKIEKFDDYDGAIWTGQTSRQIFVIEP